MSNDLVLKDHPSYRHLFEDNSETPKEELRWNKISPSLMRTTDKRYSCRKVLVEGVVSYELWKGMVDPFQRLVGTAASFEAIKEMVKA